jgi:hypothetical protein
MVYPLLQVEPKTRSDCLSGGINSERPCKWSGCEYHFRDARDGAVCCVLDIADSGEKTLDEVADILGVSKERIRQIEARALRRIKRRLKVLYDTSS